MISAWQGASKESGEDLRVSKVGCGVHCHKCRCGQRIAIITP